jgi:hypothetical protein
MFLTVTCIFMEITSGDSGSRHRVIGVLKALRVVKQPKCGHESHRTQNQESLCGRGPSAVCSIKYGHIPTGPGTKKDCAGEDQQKFAGLGGRCSNDRVQ